MTIEVILVGVGALLLLAGILGGGFEVKDFKVPPISRAQRTLAILLGTLAVVSGISVSSGGDDKDGKRRIVLHSNPCANAVTAPGGGMFCGLSTQAGFDPDRADPDILYICNNGQTVSKTRCVRGCVVAPLGVPDRCR